MLDEGENEAKRVAIRQFLNGNGGITLEVPEMPDQGQWREPYLSRARILMDLYAQLFSTIESDTRRMLADPVRKPEHMFYTEFSRNEEQLVTQTHIAHYPDQRHHVFVEQLNQLQLSEKSALIPQNESWNLRIARSLHSLIDASLGIPKTTSPLAIAEIQKTPIGERIPILTRVIAIPAKDEDVFSKEEAARGLFRRDLQSWWSNFFGAPSVDSNVWAGNCTSNSRELTAWTFRYDPSRTINILEYYRRNRTSDSVWANYRALEEGVGMKLEPPNKAGYQEIHAQSIQVNLETGGIMTNFRGLHTHGPEKSTDHQYEYALHNGMLDRVNSRFDAYQWSYDEVISDILADLPFKIEPKQLVS